MKPHLVAAILATFTMPAQASYINFRVEGFGQFIAEDFVHGTYRSDPIYFVSQGTLEYRQTVGAGDANGLTVYAREENPIYSFVREYNYLFAFANAPLSNPFDRTYHPGTGVGTIVDTIPGYRYTYYGDLSLTALWETSRPYFTGAVPEILAFGLLPEPKTWAMMMGGFALAGTAMRRRQLVVTFSQSQ